MKLINAFATRGVGHSPNPSLALVLLRCYSPPSTFARSMAQGKVRNGERNQTSKPPTKVNLYCKECNSQVGIFVNEWVHLTPSYASPKEKGKTFGTRIGETTKKVPDGVAHKMAAGCEMAEVFCESCNMHIGQHCERAPDSKKAHMVGQHFYKLSKTYLKCAKTAKTVEMTIVAAEQGAPSTPKRRRDSSPAARPKTPPPQAESTASQGQSHGSARSPHKSHDAEDQTILVNRLAELERLVRMGGFATPGPTAQPAAYTQPPPLSYGPSYTALGPASSQHDQIIEDQKKQIANITAQVDSLRGTIEDLRGIIHDLRAEKSRQQSVSLQESAVMNRFDEMIRTVRDGQNSVAAVDVLRAENKRLKERLSTIAGAMDVHPDGSEGEAAGRNGLGKRKRDEDNANRTSSHNAGSFGPNDGYSAPNGSEPVHPPTPESLQELMNGRVGTPAMHHVPNTHSYAQPHSARYGTPALGHQYSDPSMGQHSASGPRYGPPYADDGPYANAMDRLAKSGVPQYGASYMARPESRASRRATTTYNGRTSRNSGAEDNNVEFSDDEIATPAPGDAPLSVPRKRPAPPVFPNIEPTPNHRGSRMGSTFTNPSHPGFYQDPYYARPPLVAPVQSNLYRPPTYPRPGTCTSLRQPATAPGIHNALNFTPGEVAKRVVRKKRTSGSDNGDKEESSPALDAASGEHDSIPIPIDPALEQYSRGRGDSTEDDAPLAPVPSRRRKDNSSRQEIIDSVDELAHDP